MKSAKEFFFCCVLIILFSPSGKAQELFPLNEPASTMPKGVIGARAYGESFKALSTVRNLGVLRVMYGLTSKLTVELNAAEGNHHGEFLPSNLVTHTHVGQQTVYFTQSVSRGIPYPMEFNGFDFYAKYRFLSIDGQNRHFRMAVYGEFSNVNVAHDEAEPTLLDDTKGWSTGLITTWLNKRFAASFTTGIIIPGTYREVVPFGPGNAPSADIHTDLTYGKAIQYNLSFGYLLSPKPTEYKSYIQNNWNIYLEFIGKSYDSAKVVQNGAIVPIQTYLLKSGYYVEVYPGIQKIINSNFRADISVGLPLINQSWVHFYPVVWVGIQQYFYPRKHKNKPLRKKLSPPDTPN